MGINDGFSIVNRHFARGLYNQRPKNYTIYVDGELMRYKGMISENLTLAAPEESIAETSFQSLVRIIMSLEAHLGKPYGKVIVYLDGERVRNKTCDRPQFHYDTYLIRTTFKNYCMDMNYTVIELDHGESELQMYLDRDRTCDLNVFITGDSDMMSICYRHRPTLVHKSSGKQYFDIDEQAFRDLYDKYQTPDLMWSSLSNESIGSARSINDCNSSYNLPDNYPYTITDSCLWLANKNKTPPQAIGMDLCDYHLNINDLVFRTFLALKGTDFTANSRMCTNSMVDVFLSSSSDDLDFLNAKSLEMYHGKNPLCWHYIAAAILFLSLKCEKGATLVRGNIKYRQFNADDLNLLLSTYYKYVTTGIMNETTHQVNMVLGVKYYLYALFGGETKDFNKKNYTKYANRLTLTEAMSNFEKYFTTDIDLTTTTGSTTSSSSGSNSNTTKQQSRKRKMTTTTIFTDLVKPEMKSIQPDCIDYDDDDDDNDDGFSKHFKF